MLAVFIPVFCALLVINFILFHSVQWEQMFDFVDLGGSNF